MNFRTTLILAVLVVAAAVLIVVLQRQGEPPDRDGVTLTARRVFPDVSDADITRIEIERRETGDKVVLEKADGMWRLVEPVQARADWRQAGAAATELANLSYGRAVVLNMANIQGFGLAPAVATVRFTAKDKVLELEVGNEGGFGNERFTYVRLPKAETAYLAKSALHSHFTAELAGYRDKKLVAWGPFDVAAVSLTRGEKTLRAERLGPRWIISSPVSTRADTEALGDLVSAATGLSAETFVSDDPGQGTPRYGFNAPRLMVTLEKRIDDSVLEKQLAEDETKEPKPETLTITVGGHENLEKSRAYVRISNSPGVVTVDEQKVRNLEKDLLALRDKHAVPIGTGSVTYLAIDVAGSAVAVETVGGGRWQIVAPQKAPAEASEVDALIDRLKELKVREFDDNADPASDEYGFTKPHATITFRHEGDASDTTVIVAKHTETGRMWVLLPGTTTAGRVEAEDVRKLQTTWLDLHRRDLWRIPDGRQIAAISWTRRGETVEIVRETPGGETAWKMTAPVAEQLDAEKVNTLADTLKTVDAGKFLAPASGSGEYGLDEPQIVLTVTDRPSSGGGEEATVHVLHVAEKDGQFVAMTPGGALVFEADKDLVEKLSQPMSKDPWGKLDTDRVHRLEITGPGIDLHFNRAGKEWSVDNVADFPVDSMRVRWFLGDLSDAKASKVVAYAATDLAGYGLDKPEWRFRVKGLGVDRTVLIAATGPAAGRYATVEGSGRVIVLDSSNVSRLTKDKSNYRKKN